MSTEESGVETGGAVGAGRAEAVGAQSVVLRKAEEMAPVLRLPRRRRLRGGGFTRQADASVRMFQEGRGLLMSKPWSSSSSLSSIMRPSNVSSQVQMQGGVSVGVSGTLRTGAGTSGRGREAVSGEMTVSVGTLRTGAAVCCTGGATASGNGSRGSGPGAGRGGLVSKAGGGG